MITCFAFGSSRNIMRTLANFPYFYRKTVNNAYVDRRRKVCVYQVVNRNPVYTDRVLFI